MSIKDFFQNRIVQHLLFWTAILILSISKDYTEYNESSLMEIFTYKFPYFIFQVISSYLFAYYLLPKLYFKKKYLLFTIVSLFTIYITSVVNRIMTIYVVEPLVRMPPFEQETILEILTEIKPLTLHYSFPIYSTTLIFLFVKFFVDYKKENEKILRLNKEKSEVELKTLKAQLNPHFLFNTLNNIYSLSIDNSPKTPVAIGKLSEILDYVLYKCNSDFVPVSSEIELLKNYIELEKLRYDERLEINFNTDIKTDNPVPPLILLSLVENAFKHGAGEDSGSPKIWIEVKTEHTKTEFTISNTVSYISKKDKKENIGLPNIQKQLGLLYGNNYSLNTIAEKNLFKVALTIKTNPIE